jgi:hypothetical protein
MDYHERTEATTPTTRRRLVELEEAPPSGLQQPQQPPAAEAMIRATTSRKMAQDASVRTGLPGYTHSRPGTWVSSGWQLQEDSLIHHRLDDHNHIVLAKTK